MIVEYAGQGLGGVLRSKEEGGDRLLPIQVEAQTLDDSVVFLRDRLAKDANGSVYCREISEQAVKLHNSVLVVGLRVALLSVASVEINFSVV